MEKLYEPIFGLSKDMVMGLPISVRMFFTGISFSIAGIWIDRRGWREPFISGLLMSGAGILYSWMAPDAIQFILSRALFGLGYGFALMASQGFVIAYTDETNKAQGLAKLFAGVYAGSICGGAAGAMLAERIGYSPVFLLGSIIIFLIVPYTMIFMRRTSSLKKTQIISVQQKADKTKETSTWQFLSNRNVISLILLSSIPAAIAVIGLLNYFSPIYLKRIGASQSNIGRIFMIYGVSLIYIAPYLSKFVDSSHNKKNYVIISGVLGSVAFLSFYLLGGYAGTIMAVSMLGIAASFGGARRAYILRLDTTRSIGSGKALGLFNSAVRIGQVLGPITVGWLVGIFGVNMGITYLGVAYLVFTMLFFLFAQSDKTFGMKL
jgi:predicted MFS family arabinose efflux permease